MAVATLPFSRLSLLHSSTSCASTSSPKPGNLRLASSHSFTPLAHVAFRGFSVSDVRRRASIIVAAAAPTHKKKADSAVKRARQAENRRVRNKAQKSEIRTRMKKVFVAIEGLKKDASASEQMLSPIETLIGEAFSTIDKSVKVGTLHRNTGARRKSRLSRAKRVLEVEQGWYTPTLATATAVVLRMHGIVNQLPNSKPQLTVECSWLPKVLKLISISIHVYLLIANHFRPSGLAPCCICGINSYVKV
ncbi:hypothetical protein GOP47_0010604 [Adiantum capillus-veneris]|uniref:30S ribosomal protein S20, chloroplastic n=1 Tax=Adiantum capillus-veneris TaxID=13818 RepID=A0A9D4UW58_ADICA|nr:hypothetical protein GOP47_0010604 [Adiantum capillus-veneris]